MKIPKKMKICGLNYKVILEKDLAIKEGLAGQHSTSEQIIRINKNTYHQQRIEQTFLHEVLHAIDVSYNNDSLEEAEVDRLSRGLYQVLSDNGLLK